MLKRHEKGVHFKVYAFKNLKITLTVVLTLIHTLTLTFELVGHEKF